MTRQSQNKTSSSLPSTQKMNVRTRGLFMLIIGLGLAKWQVYDPLHAREQGAEQVTVYSLLVGLAVLLTIFGTATLLMGKRMEKIVEDLRIDPKRLSWKSITVLLFMALVAGSTWIWILLELSAQGYH